MDKRVIKYVFDFDTDKKVEFEMQFDAETMDYLPGSTRFVSEWTLLPVEKCHHCPLDEKTHQHCPVAANLCSVANHFRKEKSHRKTLVGVHTPERSYLKKVDMQEGLFSIFGLIMPTSGCPHLDFLKSMAKFHLPFANGDETLVRSMSMYLLQQYCKFSQEGGEFKIDLEKMEKMYDNVKDVNKGIIARIRTTAKDRGDSNENAIVALDAYAMLLSMEIQANLSDISRIIAYNKEKKFL